MEIIAVNETLSLDSDTSSELLWLTVNDAAKVEKALVEIRHPVSIDSLSSQSQITEQKELELVRRFLQYDFTEQRYQFTYDGFDEAGRYELFFYVQDATTQQIDPATGQITYTGDISPVHYGVVYKNRENNQAPTAFDLLSPENQAEPQTVLLFDWQDSSDSDGVRYNLHIATDSNMQNIVHRQEDLATSLTHMDDSSPVWDAESNTFKDGLKDGLSYYWQVEAVDGFGARTTSPIYSFTTNNPSFPPGVHSIQVVDDLYATPIEANIEIDSSPEILGGKWDITKLCCHKVHMQ